MDDDRLRRSMDLSVAEGSLATVMGALVSGVFLTGYALEMGASRLQIGVLSALPIFANLAQLGGAFLIERRGDCKRLCLVTTLIGRLLWIPIFLAPLSLSGSGVTGIWCMLTLLAVTSLCSSAGGVCWLVWTKNLIPESRIVAFLGRRHVYNTGLSLVMGMMAASYLDWMRGNGKAIAGFQIVFAVAIGCGLSGLILLSAIPAPAMSATNSASLRRLALAPLGDARFRKLLVYYGVWNAGVQLAQPFFAVYMIQKMHLSFGYITVLATISSTLGLVTSNFWTRQFIRFGTKPILLIVTLADLIITMLWLFLTPDRCGLLILIHCAGIFSAPLAMAPNNMLFRLCPEKNSSFYMAVFNSVIGMAGAVAAVGGGILATAFLNWHIPIGSVDVGGLKLLFLISAIVRLASLPLLNLVLEPDASTVTGVIRILRFPSIGAAAFRRLQAEGEQAA